MSWDEAGWLQKRHERLTSYPCQPGKWRYDIKLSYACDTLEDVPIERNPHSLGGYTGHSCFYRSRNWSTIFPVYDWYDLGNVRHCRMLVENNNPDPVWGERIELFSTSSTFQDESWGHNVANKFAHFRGRFWRIAWHEFLHSEDGPMFRMDPYSNTPVAGPPGTIRVRIFDHPRFELGNLHWHWPMHPGWDDKTEKVNWMKEGF